MDHSKNCPFKLVHKSCDNFSDFILEGWLNDCQSLVKQYLHEPLVATWLAWPYVASKKKTTFMQQGKDIANGFVFALLSFWATNDFA